jgi:4-alpha-glucanotransferase
MNKRASGILLHITSLPSPYGVGDLGPHAYAMIDFLRSAGQRYWQILPVNPTDGINGHSPYSCFSAFAGNPFFISPELLVMEEYLTSKDLASKPKFEENSVDYGKMGAFKDKLFNAAFTRWSKKKPGEDYNRFYQKHSFWLDDFAIFTVAKSVYGGKSWNEWPMGLRRRNKPTLAKFCKDNATAIARVKFIQFLFFGQWKKFKTYAHSQHVRIIGDIPIYVNFDSVEVWCYPKLFKLYDNGQSKFVSGCPPDYFSKTGQRWGSPVYDWAQLKKEKYSWWAKRIEHNLEMFDFLRIDHFRGFISYWQIPAHEKFAVFGRWIKGPGDDFFRTLLKKFSRVAIIAEDLGEITPDVTATMKRFGFPGMRVLLFGFGGDVKTNPHVPANYPIHCVAYTGTHDNNTVQGWYHHEAKPYEKTNIPKVLGIKKINAREIHWAMIKALLDSKAETAIIPMADVLGLGAEARMNTPATKIHNWKWRLSKRAITPALSKKLFKCTRAGGRT